MKNRDYRELQLSSSHLVLIFLAILILGIIIFLLGVSVGKKQAQLMKKSEFSTEAGLEQVKEQTPLPAEVPKDSISKELASHRKVQKETQQETSPPAGQTLWYIQVGAFKEKTRAIAFAESFKKEGHQAMVLDPFQSDKSAVFRVRIGGFESKEKAEEVQKKLKSPTRKKTKYFIIKA